MYSTSFNLPVELLSYIFSLSTHANGERDGEPKITTKSVKMPLALSSVNHHWKEVALRAPGLWSSLCITRELLDSGMLNTTHITSYLTLSRNSPLDIAIYARDRDWKHQEPGIPSEDGFESYTPPISSEHMSIIVSLLIPHLCRWKWFCIVTDTWLPMHTALTSINPHIVRLGAPLLESLTLIRANHSISFSPQFLPEEMKEPAFLHRDSTTVSPRDILPRLKHLALLGVHVDWDSLIDSLSASECGLTRLKMASHCADVRPSLAQFKKLLSSSPGLLNLLVHSSGPYIPDDDDDDDEAAHDYRTVYLPHLREISIAYRSALEGEKLLKLLHAPNARLLALGDAAHPADPEAVDASSMLTYIGTKDEPVASFPLLESVALECVNANGPSLRAFFCSLPNLKRLELAGRFRKAVKALLPALPSPPTIPSPPTPLPTLPSPTYLPPPIPTPAPASPNCPCPCPRLRSLCIKELPGAYLENLVTKLFDSKLQHRGTCGLREVDIHVDAPRVVRAGESRTGVGGMKVNIFYNSSDANNGDGDGYEDGVPF
ncbi:hypothetical protein B0H34DRAFT_791801 [Crassisporium funariophilum]|nr:hypothetical protein B0H34DRAFT_791801 [Crassisporium funariophilum]